MKKIKKEYTNHNTQKLKNRILGLFQSHTTISTNAENQFGKE
jgi:hypothetical protein